MIADVYVDDASGAATKNSGVDILSYPIGGGRKLM
jgi:hypothetical protein